MQRYGVHAVGSLIDAFNDICRLSECGAFMSSRLPDTYRFPLSQATQCCCPASTCEEHEISAATVGLQSPTMKAMYHTRPLDNLLAVISVINDETGLTGHMFDICDNQLFHCQSET
jgi:hypothetical protein